MQTGSETERPLGRITTSGSVTNFPSSDNSVSSVTTGTDGDIWATNVGIPGDIERFTPTGTEADFRDPTSFNQPHSITPGPDGALWFAPGNGGDSIGRITASGSITIYTNPLILPEPNGSHGPTGITAGPDGAVWFVNADSIGRITTADSVVASPSQGTPDTAVTLTGSGFNSGEAVVVKFLTGLTTSPSDTLCSTTASGEGTFTCSGDIPTTAGTPAVHTIKATGKTSKVTAKTTFLLTG
jgi:virginiamycin B lyase